MTFKELEERIIPLPDKIVFVSTPLNRDDTIFKRIMNMTFENRKKYTWENIVYHRLVHHNIEDSINAFTFMSQLGVSWHPEMKFEDLIEYNGFLVEV